MPGLRARRADRVTRGGRATAPPRRAAKTARKPARRRPWPRLTRRRLRLVAGALAILAVAGGGVELWRSGVVGETVEKGRRLAIAASLDAGLMVREIYIVGRGNASLEMLRQALAIERGDAILALDLEAARARLEALSWVAAASVERHLPDILFVRIVEHRPMALWQHQGQMTLVDSRGMVLAESSLQRFATLPLAVGEDAPAHLPALLTVLAGEPEMAARVTAVTWVGRRRWNLDIDGRIKVKLPEGDTAAAWQRLARMQRRDRILDRALSVLDLRHDDRVVLRPAADAVPPGRESDA